MSGHRQAAVALHALDDADRSLILDQLPAADQTTLRGYLAELAALGFESAAMDGMPQATQTIQSASDLASASAAAMFALLEHEPAALVAQVLAARQWNWHAGLLALCTPARREAIRAAQVAPAPARTRFLLESLGSRLADATTAPAAPDLPRSAWPLAPLLRLVKSWQR